MGGTEEIRVETPLQTRSRALVDRVRKTLADYNDAFGRLTQAEKQQFAAMGMLRVATQKVLLIREMQNFLAAMPDTVGTAEQESNTVAVMAVMALLVRAVQKLKEGEPVTVALLDGAGVALQQYVTREEADMLAPQSFLEHYKLFPTEVKTALSGNIPSQNSSSSTSAVGATPVAPITALPDIPKPVALPPLPTLPTTAGATPAAKKTVGWGGETYEPAPVRDEPPVEDNKLARYWAEK